MNAPLRTRRTALVERTNSDDLCDMFATYNKKTVASSTLAPVAPSTPVSQFKKRFEVNKGVAIFPSENISPRKPFVKSVRRNSIVTTQPEAAPSTPVSQFKKRFEVQKRASISHSENTSTPKPFGKSVRRNSIVTTQPVNDSSKSASHFTNNPVFQRRCNRFATTIQSAVRGWMQRRQYIQMKAKILEKEAAERQSALEKEIAQRQSVAAVKMQSLVRGWLGRLRARIRELEAKLAMIEAKREQGVNSILRRSRKSMKKLEKEEKERVESVDSLDGLLKSSSQVIDNLKEENRKLREQNKMLKKATSIMAAKNERTLKLIDLTNHNIDRVKAALPRLEADNKEITRVSKEYEERIAEYTAALARCEEYIECEHSIAELVMGRIKKMAEKVKSDSEEPGFSDYIANLARKNLASSK